MPTAQLGDQLVHWTERGDARILYVHGVPHAASMWEPFLERTGGVAVDLPGFGQSGKRGDTDYSFLALGRFVTAFLDHLGWTEGVRLCVHDWGGVGLLAAMDQPQRFARIAAMNTVPFMPGYRWHFIARQWRTPIVGELAMGFTNGWLAHKLGLPKVYVEEVMATYDTGTQRAILKLYRSGDPDKLAAAGEGRLAKIACPVLIAWAGSDQYIGPEFGRRYPALFGGPAELIEYPAAGHWPWLDDPKVVDDVTAFLTG